MHTVSFFSFKGGVGRTNLLLNVAYGLAREGAFVVVADWDLQAPGLTRMERLAQPKPENAEEVCYPEGPDIRRGVLDFLDAILQKDAPIPDPKTMAAPTRLGQEVRAESTPQAPTGDVWFVPAGRFRPDDEDQRYHKQLLRVQNHNLAGWKYLFEETGEIGDPVEVLRFFRSRIEEVEHPELGRKPEYLLLDARTGMTEIGDLMTAERFADRMVVVTGLNDQNLSGLEAVVRDLQSHVEPGDLLRHLTLVVSPVPEGEEELKRERLERLVALIDRLARDLGHGEKELMPELHQIPYHPRIALTEDPMLQRFPTSGPARAALGVTREVQRKRWAVETKGPQQRDEIQHIEIDRHPWTRLPVWNWPEPPVNVVNFLPGATDAFMNDLSRSITTSKQAKITMLKNLAEDQESVRNLQQWAVLLRKERRDLHDTRREHWVKLLVQGVRNLLEWLEIWCLRRSTKEEDVLASLLTGRLNTHLGGWAKHPEFWNSLAFFLLQKDRWTEAERACKAAIDCEASTSRSSGLRHNLGHLRAHLGRYEEAEAAYREAIDLDPTDPYPWNGLGNLFAEHLDRHEKAEAAYRKSIRFDSKLALPWHNLGRLKSLQRQYEEAERAYKKAIELDPRDADSWSGLATVQSRQGRDQDARESYSRAIDIDPANSSLILGDAELALVEGDLSRAEERLKHVDQQGKKRRVLSMLKLAFALAKEVTKDVRAVHRELSLLTASLDIPSAWHYADLAPFIDRLPDASARLLREWIRAVKHEDGADPEAALTAYLESDS